MNGQLKTSKASITLCFLANLREHWRLTGGKLSLIYERSSMGQGQGPVRKRSKSEALLLRSGGYHKEYDYEAERLTYFCWPLFCLSYYFHIFKS